MPALVPTMAVPAVCTSNLRGLLAHYRDAWGFEVKQEVPGVLAVVQHGPVRLQLWQRPDAVPGNLSVTLQGSVTELLELHARLARHCRAAHAVEPPRLRPWAAWEFSLTDAQGTRLTFRQWAVNGEVGRLADRHDGGRGRHPAP